jgi:hypothetical protein
MDELLSGTIDVALERRIPFGVRLFNTRTRNGSLSLVPG